MKLLNLTIEYSDIQLNLFKNNVKYVFSKNDTLTTLITSKNNNSKGKTTLIRFILYALGYNITQTDGMKIYNYKTTLEIEFKSKKFFLVHDNNIQYILDEDKNLNYKRTTADKDYIPMINILLGIKNNYIANCLLGCFYIDQDKGWTLLNRGTVIGTYKFNIEEFLINLYNKFDVEKNFIENKILKINNDRAATLLKILKDNYIYDDNLEDNSRKEILEAVMNLENEKNNLEQICFLKKKEIKNLTALLSQNEELAKRIEDMNIIIEHKGENIIVDRKKLKNYFFNNDLLIMQKNEIEFEIKKLESEIKKLKVKIKKIRKDNQQNDSNEYLKRTFNLVKASGISIEELEILRESNRTQIKENYNIIKEEISNGVEEFWSILYPILTELELGKEYIKKEIILIDRLIGISGTQMHQLSLAFKIALNILINRKLNITLPFIIDSPKGSETSDKISDLMLNVVKKYLPNNQIIVSSVFNNFNIKFENKIELENGVVRELDKFF